MTRNSEHLLNSTVFPFSTITINKTYLGQLEKNRNEWASKEIVGPIYLTFNGVLILIGLTKVVIRV